MEDGLKLYSNASEKCSVGGGVRGGGELYGRRNTVSSPSLAPPKSCHKTELLIANFNYKPQIYFTQHGGQERIEI